MSYAPDSQRYDSMVYRRCGKSGILLPAISLGLWHNFGKNDNFDNAGALIRRAFDRGVTHFDLANNYGPPPGSAEETFGRILRRDLIAHRDELIISTKAGYQMWPGPYGDWGSKKYLIASLDASLKRMGLDYVDIFYSHRPDPKTPIAETVEALTQAVRQGKALYAGISNYDPDRTVEAVSLLEKQGVHCLIHQMKYSMLVRVCSTRWSDGVLARSRFRRSPRASSRTVIWTASPRTPGPGNRIPSCPLRPSRSSWWKNFMLWKTWRIGGDRVSPKWRSPGCSAAAG
jgi:L-glyceraldehyde 3-phosphate reductase